MPLFTGRHGNEHQSETSAADTTRISIMHVLPDTIYFISAPLASSASTNRLLRTAKVKCTQPGYIKSNHYFVQEDTNKNEMN